MRLRITLTIGLMAFMTGRLQAQDADWPRWRGPNLDGVNAEKGLLDRWPDDGPKLLWKSKGLGGGMASVVVAGDRIYTLGSGRGGVLLHALNRDDGSIIWSTPVGRGNDPNCTPTVDTKDNLVFGLTKDGDLLAADAKTGDAIWRTSFTKDFGGKMHSGWGYSESPLVDGDRLIVTPGAKDAQIVALEKKTGRVIWKSSVPDSMGNRGGDGAAYSSVVISHAAGVKQYVQLVGRGVLSVRADNGQYLWHYNRIANGTANVPTPIVVDDYVFCTSGYGDGGSALLRVRRRGQSFSVDEVYYKGSGELQNHHGGVIRVGNHIYGGHGHNKGMPFCLEWKTGRIVWVNKDPGIQALNSAAVVYADGHLVFRYENGPVTLVQATPTGYREKGRFELPNRNGPSWPHPVIAGGKLYLRNQDELQVYQLKE